MEFYLWREGFAQLCTYISQNSPEFRQGPRTINFRRIFLTKCYEALVEEECIEQVDAIDSKLEAASRIQYSWRQQCMIANVLLIGDLFRRQLLTENIMHVSMSMMLENQETLMPHVVEAACALLNMVRCNSSVTAYWLVLDQKVGDLLDGSSPASRRTTDEYFEVLEQIKRHPDASESLLATLSDVRYICTVLRFWLIWSL